MSTIKKSFEEIYAVLKANESKKVKDLLPELLELMVSKQRDSNSETDEHGLWVFCYYHKEWELIKQVEYGSKASSNTGYNTMCKVGVNNWTKQQRDFKTEKASLLDKVSAGELKIEDLQVELTRLEEEKDKIVPLYETHWDMALLEDLVRFPLPEETEEKE